MLRQTAAILLSRQPLGACGTTPWVQAAGRAVAWAKAEGLTLVTSTGMQTWELLCAAASIADLPQIVFIPACNQEEFVDREVVLRRDYHLDQNCECRPVFSRDRREQQSRRDQAVVNMADVLIPVSIREGGSLHALLETAGSSRAVVERFHVDYDSRSTPLKYALRADHLNPAVDSRASGQLIHWTRARFSPWPYEPPLEYYRDLMASDHFDHRAFDTLRHIVDSRRLIATGRHMPRHARTVSFSALPPSRVVPLMRWRARYCEMSFEPYGIGIDLRLALDLGLRPVQYYDPSRGELPDHYFPWLAQSVGKRSDWSQEHEYRHLGDFVLGNIPDESMTLFCMTPSEAAVLARSTGLRCVPLLANECPEARSASGRAAIKRVGAAPEQ